MVRPRTIVVTGASSGIGRAAAEAFAARGDAVVLAARSAESLEEAADACRESGGRAIAVQADITVEADVEHIMDAALETFGHVDVWISNAAVMAYGRFEDVPPEVHQHVVETNLVGTMRCARIALRHFRERGRGTLISVGSLYGHMTSPYVSAYVTSKFGLRGFNEVLRQELSDSPGISTSLILPASISTPIFRHTANYTGRGVRPVPPVSRPDRVVRAIVRCADRPRPEVRIGYIGRLLALGHALAPAVYDRLVPIAMELGGLTRARTEHTAGNVFEPMTEQNAIEGGWRRVPAPVSAAGVVGATGLGLWAWRRLGR